MSIAARSGAGGVAQHSRRACTLTGGPVGPSAAAVRQCFGVCTGFAQVLAQKQQGVGVGAWCSDVSRRGLTECV